MTLTAGDRAKTVLSAWLALGGIALCALVSALAGLFTPWLLVGSGVIGLATVIVSLWYPPRYAASLRGSYDGAAVRARKGVLWKTELYIPVSSLRTFELSQTPLQRRYNCCTVVLRFAGGAAILPLLSAETGERLTHELKQAENLG